MVEVVAALIWESGRFLICRRPYHKARGGLWEFVGGKIEAGESPQDALIRECREEMDIALSVGEKFMDVVHEYPDITVHLSIFNSQIVSGTPRLLEHSQLAWIHPSEIENYDFCPADKDILEKIKKTCDRPSI